VDRIIASTGGRTTLSRPTAFICDACVRILTPLASPPTRSGTCLNPTSGH
jgi:hypothetical protein